jgi:hypothetical protein
MPFGKIAASRMEITVRLSPRRLAHATKADSCPSHIDGGHRFGKCMIGIKETTGVKA